MSDWQERITHETAPSIRVEHDLRYRCAAPVILSGGPWADLGCGNGLAAAAALGDRRPGHVVLVDLDPAAVETAAIELGLPAARRMSGDLTDPGVLEEIGGELTEAQGEPVVSCFEVVEHLSTFLPLIEWALEMVGRHRATFVLSVPNDAFWSMQNPHHLTCWSEGAFDELAGLLPPERTMLRQIALSGSALTGWDAEATEHRLAARLDPASAVASHFLLAFGPRHEELWRGAMAMQADAAEARRWERERESQLVESRQAIAAQDETIARQARELQEQTAQFDAWRTYIHELEGELGRAPSGGTAGTKPA